MTDEIIEKTIGRPATGNTSFDLKLFLQLNEEYKDKPVIPAPRKSDDNSRLVLARQRAELLDERVGVRGRRVLEVGCGAGDMSGVLAKEYDCEVVGLDIAEYGTWKQYNHPKLDLKVLDISEDHSPLEGKFDRIVSLVVWEHIHHPFSALCASRDLLHPDGLFYLRANLYRSAVASHRYREIFFPWPHLLFSDGVFEEFYEHIARKPKRAAWVNKLTYAQYLYYFRVLGFVPQREWLSHRALDEEFYGRFEDQLSRYPIFDLTHDYFDVILKLESKQALRRESPANTAAESLVMDLGERLLPDATAKRNIEKTVTALRRVFDSRRGRIAERVCRIPRDWKYWVRLPWDLLRIAMNRADRPNGK
ncbi:MAG: class I SAM-dependent methyltransferase [Planctomycetota bacterium]|jgi:SAM-dependent methyltransferase